MNKYIRLGNMEIGGQTRPFQVNSTRQTEAFTDTLGIELDEYWTMLTTMSNGKVLTNNKITIVFLWSCLYAGAMKETRTCGFTHDDVIDWFEEADASQANEYAKPLQTLFDILEDKKKELQDEPRMAVSNK